MANKTIPLKLFRTHYQVAEVAKMLNCEEADVFIWQERMNFHSLHMLAGRVISQSIELDV